MESILPYQNIWLSMLHWGRSSGFSVSVTLCVVIAFASFSSDKINRKNTGINLLVNAFTININCRWAHSKTGLFSREHFLNLDKRFMSIYFLIVAVRHFYVLFISCHNHLLHSFLLSFWFFSVLQLFNNLLIYNLFLSVY